MNLYSDDILGAAKKLKEYAETFQTRITNDIMIELEEKFKILNSGIELKTHDWRLLNKIISMLIN